MALFPPELGDRFTYLMLFEDGTRIDLMLIPIEEMDEYMREDHLTVILLDKDCLLYTSRCVSETRSDCRGVRD